MKTNLTLAVLLAVGSSLLAAESRPKDDVTSAVGKLAQDNYSWTTSVEFGGFPPSTSTGKASKDGLAFIAMKFGENTTEAFLKEGKGAVKRNDEAWQSLEEINSDGQQGRGRFLGRMLQNYRTPASEAKYIVGKVKALTKDGEAYAGELTEEGAKDLLSFGGNRGGNAPEPKNAKGSVKFWVKNGTLSKFEIKLQGTMFFNNEDRDVSRTTVVEIKDVGATKVEMPEEAKKKLS